ncbi:MAG: hypothetical protein LDL31_10180, partial [Prosthecobacter sp.]|nr:hypothetical protein [Prosthecobacter sp.]
QPALSSVLKSLYQLAITHLPSSWRMVYQWLGRMDLDAGQNVWLSPLTKALHRRLVMQQPRVIVSTYPLYAGLLHALRGQAAVPPLVTVVTDSTSIHKIWLMAPSDLYCVADVESQEVLAAMGVKPSRVRVTGFPVSLQFTEPPPPPMPGRSILYLPSTPGRHVAATLEALRPLLLGGVRLTLPVGKHASRLHHVLCRFTDSMPPEAVEIIGWTRRIPDFLRSHDVVICKAGGAILHEVMAARIPAVIDYVVPGQEEGNADYLLSRGCALRSQSPTETGTAVANLLADGGKLARQMRENMLSISIPDAALRTAQEVLARATEGAPLTSSGTAA